MAPQEDDKHAHRERRQTHLGRARGLLDIADRVLEGVPSVGGGAALLAAMALYREATFWALTAEQDAAVAATMGEALARIPPEALAAKVGQSAPIERIRDSLTRSSAASAVLGEAQQQREEVRLLEIFAHRAVARLEGADRDARRKTLRRWAPGALLSVALVVVGGGLFLMTRRDLAANRPWRTSSAAPDCELTYNTCQGQSVNIFFHTIEEESPWVEIDLGSVRTFSRVIIRNRQDCCKERAAPLAIEISDDGSTFGEVARRQDVFDEWDAKFPTVHARFVRARALRRTVLHLEGISVR